MPLIDTSFKRVVDIIGPIAPRVKQDITLVKYATRYPEAVPLKKITTEAVTDSLKKVLKGLSGVGSYIDDIVIYSDSWEEHLRTLKELFGRLRRARITARPTECLLEENRMENSMSNHQEASEILPRFSRLLQRPHPSLRRDLSATVRPLQERKARTSTMERSTGACVLTVQGVSATRTSIEAS